MEGDHVWLAVDPRATLKNGSCLLQTDGQDDDHLEPFSRKGKPTTEVIKDGLITKPTGLVRKVQKSTGDCLVEWGAVGHCPPGMSHKLLWCTPSELKKVHARKKVMVTAKSSMVARTLSTLRQNGVTAERCSSFGDTVNPSARKIPNTARNQQISRMMPRAEADALQKYG